VTSDWREDLEKDPRVIKLRKSIWDKWRKLGRNKGLVLETTRLKLRLEKAYEKDPKSVNVFFRRYSCPTGSRRREIRRHIASILNKGVRDVLRLYIKYVARFGVTMYTRKKKPHFRTALLPPHGSKFHVALSNGHLRPARPFRGGRYTDYFEDKEVQMPEVLERYVQTGTTKFVRIDDKDSSSVLTELEAFAYHWEGLTFILHEAEQPYIICLIGENASSDMWKSAARAVHALRRECYGEKAGRTGNLRQILKVGAQLRQTGASKAKAITVGKTKNVDTSKSAFSRLKAKLT
jgi:hypothetical protein